MDIIGADDQWNAKAPAGFSQVGAVKIATQNTKLYPGETLKIALRTTAPVGTPTGAEAWKSFAAQGIYVDVLGNRHQLLAVEGEKVCVQLVSTPENRGKISGTAYLPPEEGINDVAVLLRDNQNQVISVSFTAQTQPAPPGSISSIT